MGYRHLYQQMLLGSTASITSLTTAALYTPTYYRYPDFIGQRAHPSTAVFSINGVTGLPVSYAHRWHMRVGGVTQPFSIVKRLCPTTGLIEFAEGFASATSVQLTYTTYFNAAASGVGIRVRGATGLNRTNDVGLVDVTRMGDSYRRRIPGVKSKGWVFDLQVGDHELALLQRSQQTGEVLFCQLLSNGRMAMLTGADWSSMVAEELEYGDSYGGWYSTYAAHVRVDSVEVTGSVDGVPEAVVGMTVEPVKDAVLRTKIFDEIDFASTGAIYNP